MKQLDSFNIPKLPPQALNLLVPFFLTFIMSGVISIISVIKSIGINTALIGIWLPTWLYSWMVAFPTALVVLPLAKKFSLLFVKNP
ncbi:DUF2798 domain-containing protein [Acinetobacter baumannii]|uniref:DUF2798 domain-containing protein n=1 Tax=Acinetobacter baumannii TaxID=470 RepID=UPI00044C6C13|nr:DUF2798 domain-containing protein [Acinetobacter baumannii]EXA60435.1 hypothetical protein J521_2911 [Acinetobacter baumannii 1035119]MCZ3154154.1 DUF2798 domain-containing protein [Acinetobacter baumannii]MDC5041333.1 DUF2798 domain-containing protein [Acinetobacter baumannii]MDC5196857.1 DUF2798 domain-containing protein [Acinetobacter baumannii]MDC5209747.1 DUF2798 domain-containing protein [Acinetobacter baumannii]